MYDALAARPSGSKDVPRPRQISRIAQSVRPGQPLAPSVPKKRTYSSMAEALAEGPQAGPSNLKKKPGQSLAPWVSPGAAVGAKAVCKVVGPQNRRSSFDPGSTFETDFEHLRRHKAKARNCLRCIYLTNPKILDGCAKLPLPSGGVGSWLQPAPSFKGQWGLGCRVCAAQRFSVQPLAGNLKAAGPKRKHKKKDVKDAMLRKRDQPRFSKFAKFEIRAATSLKRTRGIIEMHGNSQAHMLAVRAMAQQEHASQGYPKALVEGPPPPIDRVAEKTFRGRVPKPRDWMDCFVETTNQMSWRKQAKVRIAKEATKRDVEPLAKQREGQPLAASPEGQPLAAPRETLDNLRKRRRKQTRFIAEVVRRKHRRALRGAHFCTLALDDAQGRKLVHFRCDYHQKPWFYQGTLGVYKSTPKTQEEGEGDHAAKGMKRLDEFLTKFCTPLRKGQPLAAPPQGQPLAACDQELKDHILKITSTISADGGSAERRAIYLACATGS